MFFLDCFCARGTLINLFFFFCQKKWWRNLSFHRSTPQKKGTRRGQQKPSTTIISSSLIEQKGKTPWASHFLSLSPSVLPLCFSRVDAKPPAVQRSFLQIDFFLVPFYLFAPGEESTWQHCISADLASFSFWRPFWQMDLPSSIGGGRGSEWTEDINHEFIHDQKKKEIWQLTVKVQMSLTWKWNSNRTQHDAQ